MTERGTTPFFAKCGKCSHCWELYRSPIDLVVAAKLMRRATCPVCGASGKSILMAKQDAGILLEGRPSPDRGATEEGRAYQWLASGDTGISSKAMWSVMMGQTPQPGPGGLSACHPSDAQDLGRCLRLLDLIPEWKVHIGRMRGLSKYWDALIDRWEDLTAMMTEEVGIAFDKGRRADKTYALMREILKPVEDADRRFVRLSPTMSVRF